MNKFAIPAMLVATVLVAGAFSFAPVEKASTVHTTNAIGGATFGNVDTSVSSATGLYGSNITATCSNDFVVHYTLTNDTLATDENVILVVDTDSTGTTAGQTTLNVTGVSSHGGHGNEAFTGSIALTGGSTLNIGHDDTENQKFADWQVTAICGGASPTVSP